MAHKLMTKELAAALPPLYSQEDKGDEAVVQVHYFSTRSGWDWWATEGSLVCPTHATIDCPECPKDTWTNYLFFGLVRGAETELGYFSLTELDEASAARRGLGVERDLHWRPKTLAQVREGL